MKYSIKPMEPNHAKGISEMRRMKGVIETITALPSEHDSTMLMLIENMDEYMHAFVAVDNETELVLGMAWLTVNGSGRRRHSASLAIMVHANYQKKGIGNALMAKLIDLADNWLMLKRVELEVDSWNMAAISLYKKFGFVEEGIRKAAIISNGQYVDDFIMARVK